MTQKENTRRGFTQNKRVGQALPDNAPAKGHLAAFTLIELLVVILIIGILAAVAVPQYQRAVAKSRMTQLITAVKSVAVAQKAYYLANGVYADKFSELDIDFDFLPLRQADSIGTLASSDAVRANDNWEILLNRADGIVQVVACLRNGEFSCSNGRAIAYRLAWPDEPALNDKLICIAKRSTDKWCSELLNTSKTPTHNGLGGRYYEIPY